MLMRFFVLILLWARRQREAHSRELSCVLGALGRFLRDGPGPPLSRGRRAQVHFLQGGGRGDTEPGA